MSNILISNMELPKQGWLKLIILPNGEVRKVDTGNEAVIPTESKAVDYPSQWHTGTPTEDGDYIIAFHPWGRKENKIRYKDLIWKDDHWFDPATEYKTEPYLVAWQRIEPYKEKTE